MLQETSKDGMPDGADIFFPCSVYAICQLSKYQITNSESTKLLQSNLNYVRYFRQESFLHGQDDYYLQTLESVVEFVLNLSEKYKTDLKLNEGEELPPAANEMPDEWSWGFNDDQPATAQSSTQQ